MKKAPNDPVHQDEEDGKWYFWDETWSERHGPYESELGAYKAVLEYAAAWINKLRKV